TGQSCQSRKRCPWWARTLPTLILSHLKYSVFLSTAFCLRSINMPPRERPRKAATRSKPSPTPLNKEDGSVHPKAQLTLARFFKTPPTLAAKEHPPTAPIGKTMPPSADGGLPGRPGTEIVIDQTSDDCSILEVGIKGSNCSSRSSSSSNNNNNNSNGHYNKDAELLEGRTVAVAAAVSTSDKAGAAGLEADWPSPVGVMLGCSGGSGAATSNSGDKAKDLLP
ncbi:unnamed protein product, partial [Discosporangium mesarthrocarpum]